MPTLLPRFGVNSTVYQCRLQRTDTSFEGLLQFVRRSNITGSPSEGGNQAVVAGLCIQRGGRRIKSSAKVGVRAVVDASVVQYNNSDGQTVAADGLYLISMPLKPKALSPSMQTTGLPLVTAAPMV